MRFTTEYAVITYIIQKLKVFIVTILQQRVFWKNKKDQHNVLVNRKSLEGMIVYA
ncbi:hypothetical protein VITU9109_06795 [Vibrio tubiashii ATCC 19109]|uniref:Transposase n=1 Tax=Vibrio tubiashii ATCC 19109 TaxID=1051646 RepID=A0ABP2LKY9_9VIBR|nr:hypothetical protein VITU9109_06795 [Vibrio tubiashii ATCC 19109]